MASVITRVTEPYSDVDAWLYDKLFAAAVLDMVSGELAALCDALPPAARLLDVGCGGGQIALRILTLRGDVDVTGIDLSAAQIARARRRTRLFANRVRFVVGSATELEFPDASFDAVLSVTSIKHWPSQRQGLAECVRVVKPGGLVLISEIDRGARLEAVQALLSRSRVPRILHGPALPLFRTFIVGQAVDLDDLRELLGSVALVDGRVARIDGTLGLALTGRRAAAVTAGAGAGAPRSRSPAR